jgi:hypothetical protein
MFRRVHTSVIQLPVETSIDRPSIPSALQAVISSRNPFLSLIPGTFVPMITLVARPASLEFPQVPIAEAPPHHDHPGGRR